MIGADVATLETGTLVCDAKLNGFGVVFAAIVVAVKVVLTPPIVICALDGVLKLAEEVSLTLTESPLLTNPDPATNRPKLMAKLPPVMLIGVAVLMPVMAIVFDVTNDETGTLICGTKLNGSGVVSGAMVVMLKVLLTPPTVSVAEEVTPGVAAERT